MQPGGSPVQPGFLKTHDFFKSHLFIPSKISYYSRPMKFKGKSAFITGASEGIGRAIALEFAREGANVAVAARSSEKLDRLREELQALGVHVLAQTCDVTHRSALAAAIERTADHFGRLDILVNNAGMGLYSPLTTVRIEDFEKMMQVNFWAALHAIQASVPHLERQGGGIIINISSILGKLDYPWMGAYCASKHALNSLSNALRIELRDQNIEVLTVCPGRVRTAFQPHAIKYKPIRNPSVAGAGLSAEQVARAVVRGAWRHQREIVIPRAGWILVALQHVWPRMADKLAMAFSSK